MRLPFRRFDALGYFIAAGQLLPAPLTIEERLPESRVANFLRVARALVRVPVALANLLGHLQGAPSTIDTLPNSGRSQSSSSATHNSCHLTRPANGSSAAHVSDRNFTKQLFLSIARPVRARPPCGGGKRRGGNAACLTDGHGLLRSRLGSRLKATITGRGPRLIARQMI